MSKNNEIFHCKMDYTSAKHKEEQSRISYRAIVKRDNQYLVIQSKDGDVIFPGGGIEKGENPEEAIARELQEETGYIVSSKPEFMGSCVLKKDDKFRENAAYIIECRYYGCDVEDKIVERSLTPSELALHIVALWMSKEEIIATNEAYSKKRIDRDYWVQQMEWLMKKL
jgi:8-oxo-dGTP pyrophosphatase MutT (NUDIX family)